METNRKMILIIIISLVVVLLLYFFFHTVRNTLPDNPKERNQIKFNSSIAEVQDSLKALSGLLKSFPVYKDDWSTFCIVDTNVLGINFKRINSIDNLLNILKSNNIEELNPLTKDEQLRFLNLVVFLNKNYLYRGDFYKKSGILVYCYREYKDVGDYHTDLLRFIILSYSEQNIDKKIYKILDRKDNLYLCAYKDAKIWEGEKK